MALENLAPLLSDSILNSYYNKGVRLNKILYPQSVKEILDAFDESTGLQTLYSTDNTLSFYIEVPPHSDSLVKSFKKDYEDLMAFASNPPLKIKVYYKEYQS